MNVKTMFLHGNLKEVIYMEQSPEYEVYKNKDKVSSREIAAWFELVTASMVQPFDTFMFEQGYNKSFYDACLYFKGNEVLKSIFLLLYVVYILLISSSTSKISKLLKILSKELDMKDLDDSTIVIGINIIRSRIHYSLALSHCGYLKKVVKKFCMRNAKPVIQPLANHFSLFASQCLVLASAKKTMKDIPYSTAVYSVLYTMVCSRLDIVHA